MAFNYNRLRADGRLVYYYRLYAKYKYIERGGRERELTIKHISLSASEVQYYWIELDGKFKERPMTAARLHYFLHENNAEEVLKGVDVLLPLLRDEIVQYFKDKPSARSKLCARCGGSGIDDDGNICICIRHSEDDILKYNAELRLKKIFKV